ncbi:hypothetical protein [Paramaledivibacter caminithermalis]|jgi:predicted small metal-binding protein|nr:hypothetical protein [Paramaledivibacter caminithermalis]
MYEILFNVSPDVAEHYRSWDINWSKISQEYKDEIQSRIQNALKV